MSLRGKKHEFYDYSHKPTDKHHRVCPLYQTFIFSSWLLCLQLLYFYFLKLKGKWKCPRESGLSPKVRLGHNPLFNTSFFCKTSNRRVIYFVHLYLISKSQVRCFWDDGSPHGVYLLMTFSNHSPDAPVAKATSSSEYQMTQVSCLFFVRFVLVRICFIGFK